MDFQLTQFARFKLTALAAITATLLTACAGAGQLSGASSIDMAFVRAAPTWDLDRDGVVTCDEWKQYAGQVFAEADSGNKGYLTAEDFATLAKTDHLFYAADFAYFGGASTGRVTRAAFVDKPNPAFRLLDRRKDCRLTSEELRLAYRAAHNGGGARRRSIS